VQDNSPDWAIGFATIQGSDLRLCNAREGQDMTSVDTNELAESFSFRQLRLFESVGRLNSVRQGSEECNLSQPAVTQALTKLEALLGHALLERRASGSYLTDAGAIFYRRTVRMLEQLVDALVALGVPGGRIGAITASQRLSRSQFRSLHAIIDFGSFPLAAQQLGLTPASLQRAARDLESNLRKTIFYRSAGGILVTPEGSEFARSARLALQEIEWAVQEIELELGAGESRIAIGALPFGGSVLLAGILDEFISSHPKVDVSIITEGAAEMMKRLRAGEVDIVLGLTQETTGDDLIRTELVETPYVVVARRDHPLVRPSPISVEELARFDWVVGTVGSNRRVSFEALFDAKRRPKAQIATCSLPVIRNLLASSDRLTLMTTYELVHENMLAPLPYKGNVRAPSIGITTRSNWQPTALHNAFTDLVNARVRIAVETPTLRLAS
jgi:LysR family transcriptional regulator, regulator for genes of the gallate degradation pathway